MKKYFTLSLLFMTMMMQAQDFDKAKLDQYFEVVAKKDKAMGSISIFKDGKEIEGATNQMYQTKIAIKVFMTK